MSKQSGEIEQAEIPVITDEEVLSLFKAADPDTQKAVVSLLQGEKQQGGDLMSMFAGMMGGAGEEGGENPMAAMMSMFSGMMGGTGGEGGENPMAAMMGGAGGEDGENPMAAMMSMLSGMMGGTPAEETEEK